MMEQGTPEWFAARAGKVTASKIADTLMKPTTAGYKNYAAQLICERLTGQATETFTSAAMQHGTETEPQARAMYSLETGLAVQEVGFIDHPSLPHTGASPDGLVGDNGLVEIKCPQQANHIANLMGNKIARNYWLQMQWQMECTGREWCDFVSFNPTFPDEMQIAISRVEIDPKELVEIREGVSAFLEHVAIKHEKLISQYRTEKDAA